VSNTTSMHITNIVIHIYAHMYTVWTTYSCVHNYPNRDKPTNQSNTYIYLFNTTYSLLGMPSCLILRPSIEQRFPTHFNHSKTLSNQHLPSLDSRYVVQHCNTQTGIIRIRSKPFHTYFISYYIYFKKIRKKIKRLKQHNE
jgi:hypothetical protein